jgi:hypothetical protein
LGTNEKSEAGQIPGEFFGDGTLVGKIRQRKDKCKTDGTAKDAMRPLPEVNGFKVREVYGVIETG